MAVASAKAADWQIVGDSTVAERLDDVTDGESVDAGQCCCNRSQPRRKKSPVDLGPIRSVPAYRTATALSRILKTR